MAGPDIGPWPSPLPAGTVLTRECVRLAGLPPAALTAQRRPAAGRLPPRPARAVAAAYRRPYR